MQFNHNSKYLTTAARDRVNLFQVSQATNLKRVLTVMFDPSEFSSGAGKIMACVDGNADLMMIYKGKGFTFHLYTILDDLSTGRTYKLKETLNL